MGKFFFNHYAPGSQAMDVVYYLHDQANWSNMTFTAGNLFPSHSCIGVTRVMPPLGFKPGSPA